MREKGEAIRKEGEKAASRLACHLQRSTLNAQLVSLLIPRPSLLLGISLVAALFLGGCGSVPKRGPEAIERLPPESVPPRGGYYLDDGPGDNPPPNLDAIPDAVPRPEPIRAANTRPYEALGRIYYPMTELRPFKQRGMASWYGRRYHGRKTASGEPYDMYAMTAAHPTLPLPSYARVTNLDNGKSVVVRINDRGPFLSDRIIDLSYTAAYKLGILTDGSALVEVETILPDPQPTTQTVQAGAAAKAVEPVASSGPPSAAKGAGPAPTPVATAPSGYYLQLGAFGSRENAEVFLGRLRAQLDWLASSLQLAFHERLFRVQAGPYPDAASAREAADRVAAVLSLRPLLVVR